MLANELRIGNYLKGEPFAIPKLQMHSNGVSEITAYGIHLMSEGMDVKLEPIPLNHFWFREFGFDRSTPLVTGSQDLPYIYTKHFKHEGKPLKFEVFSDDKGSLFSMYQYPKIDLEKKRYVHQLQNMYFLFTNQELIRKFKS